MCSALLSANLRLINGVYSLEDYVAMRSTTERDSVMLNAHRTNARYSCADKDASRQVLEAVRLSVLLSLNYVVVSQLSADSDMREYLGLVLFEPNMFPGAGGSWSKQTRRLLSNRTALAAFSRRNRQLFRERFDPSRILEKAGVLPKSVAAPRHHP